MFELNNILIAALQEAGLAACGEMEQPSIARPGAAVCTVGLETSDVTDTAFGQYLGTLEHPERGTVNLFGRRFCTQAALRLFAPDSAQACNRAVQTALDALVNLQGLRLGEIRMEKLGWDDEAGAYTRTLKVQLQGMLYCLQADEGEIFTDFTLLPTII